MTIEHITDIQRLNELYVTFKEELTADGYTEDAIPPVFITVTYESIDQYLLDDKQLIRDFMVQHNWSQKDVEKLIEYLFMYEDEGDANEPNR